MRKQRDDILSYFTGNCSDDLTVWGSPAWDVQGVWKVKPQYNHIMVSSKQSVSRETTVSLFVHSFSTSDTYDARPVRFVLVVWEQPVWAFLNYVSIDTDACDCVIRVAWLIASVLFSETDGGCAQGRRCSWLEQGGGGGVVSWRLLLEYK